MIVLNLRNLTIFCVHFLRRRIHFSRCILENCPTEYSSFRDMEVSEREKCYTNCNPQDANTRDRNVSRQERREIIRCLARDRCFRLNVYNFVDNAEFQRLRECADSKCPRQLRVNERVAQKYREARARRATSGPRQPDSRVSTPSQSWDLEDSTPTLPWDLQSTPSTPRVSTLLPDGRPTDGRTSITRTTSSSPGERPTARSVTPRTVTPRAPAIPVTAPNPRTTATSATPRTVTPRIVTPGIADPSETPRILENQMVSSTAAPGQFINWISWVNVFD